MKASLSRPGGFTYLMLLWWVAISGVMLGAIGQSWTMESRRQREMELEFRGNQIRAALESYRHAGVKGRQELPQSLSQLVVDKRTGEARQHLRRLWADPITGGDWGLIMAEGRILGVFSLGTMPPLRAPQGIESYADWRFEVR